MGTVTAPPIGIEKIRVYPSSLALDLEELALARDHDVADLRENLLVSQRTVLPPWEDPVTMAVNAAVPMLDDDDRRSIELVIVGSESAVDLEKPMSTWLHHFAGLGSHCRNFEVKHACYSGTAGLQMAVAWLASGLSPGGKALVVNTDHSFNCIGEPWEYVLGAGAVAMLVSREPRLVELELGKSGVHSQEVYDVFRPNGRVETGNSETSLFAYLDALHETYSGYERAVGDVDFETHFDRNLYHVPFGGMAFRAHKALLSRNGGPSKEAAWDHFTHRTLPSLTYNRRMGGTYGGSLYVALLGLIDNDPELRPGNRIGMFSYGSGSCAEFFSALVCDGARDVAAEAGLPALLDRRRRISVAEYEALENTRTESTSVPEYTPDLDGYGDLFDERYRDPGLLHLARVEEWYRRYEWGGPS